MRRAQAVVVLVAVALAVVLAGAGLYANGQPSGPTLSHTTYSAEERRIVDAGWGARPGEVLTAQERRARTDEWRRVTESGGSVRVYDDAPLAVLRSGAAPWWWFGAGAVLVLGAAALPLARRRPA